MKVKNYLFGWKDRLFQKASKFHKIFQAIPESENILNALRNQNPVGYEGQELLALFGLSALPVN